MLYANETISLYTTTNQSIVHIHTNCVPMSLSIQVSWLLYEHFFREPFLNRYHDKTELLLNIFLAIDCIAVTLYSTLFHPFVTISCCLFFLLIVALLWKYLPSNSFVSHTCQIYQYVCMFLWINVIGIIYLPNSIAHSSDVSHKYAKNNCQATNSLPHIEQIMLLQRLHFTTVNGLKRYGLFYFWRYIKVCCLSYRNNKKCTLYTCLYI